MELELISALIESSTTISRLMEQEREREMQFRRDRQEQNLRNIRVVCSTIHSQSEVSSRMRENFQIGIEILRKEDHSRSEVYAELWVQR